MAAKDYWDGSWGTSWSLAWTGDPLLAGATTAISGRQPVTRVISGRSIALAIAGAEKDYPVYRFSGRNFVERPKHNPFKGL